MDIFERSKGLLGEENFKILQEKNILVVGLGGVGGTACEALIRSGIKNITIIDYDKVDASNLNRQILYTFEDVGKSKIEAASKHLDSINPQLNLSSINMKVDDDALTKLNNVSFDYIIDAIDDVNGKISLAKFSLVHNIPIIISLGMANRFNPENVHLLSLDKTSDDPLAKKIRYEYRKNDINLKQIMCVCSNEKPLKDNGKLHSMMMVPSQAGLIMANYVIQQIIKGEQ